MPAPDTSAGVPKPTIAVLYSPDIPEPTFSTPEFSVPTLRTPEPAPANAACAWFHQPELPAPKLPKPDTPPAPELKKPDDGVAVAFPKPGVGGTMMIGTLLSGTLMLRARLSGSGSIVKPPGNIVIGSSTPDASMVNGIAFCGMLRPPGNSVKAGRPPDTSILSGIGDVVIVGMVTVGRVSARLPVVALLGPVWIRMP
ncbi:Uncharacterised protein [Mycobacterium tuberculosis]|nr:Uncharacterised protein [Mycobacterium tuberculosis]CKT66683.1 Uncharacterised protein [Mycobacterium tuberculosis]